MKTHGHHSQNKQHIIWSDGLRVSVMKTHGHHSQNKQNTNLNKKCGCMLLKEEEKEEVTPAKSLPKD